MGGESWWAALRVKEALLLHWWSHILLSKADGSVATRSSDKAEVLATHFSGTMADPDSEYRFPAVPHLKILNNHYIQRGEKTAATGRP